MRSRPLTLLPTRSVEARRRADRVSCDVALAMTAHLPSVPRFCPCCGRVDDRFHDARTGRRTIYGALLGYLDRAVRIGTPVEVLLRIPQIIEAYIRDIATPPASPALTLRTAA